MTPKQSDLSRTAALLADEPIERFLVCSYAMHGAELEQVEMAEVASADPAHRLGKEAEGTHE